MKKHERQIIAAIALIRNSKGEILLQKRYEPSLPAAHGKWEFPGGGIDFGETPEKALIRECKEEIGCRIKVLWMLPCIVVNHWKNTSGTKTQAIVLCFECRIVTGTPVSSNAEVGEIRWCTRGAIRKMPTLPGIQKFISHFE